MYKFKMWWILKGEDKTKRAIGRTCRLLFFSCVGFLVLSVLVGSIMRYGWAAVVWWGAGILFILITYAAIFWGDK